MITMKLSRNLNRLLTIAVNQQVKYHNGEENLADKAISDFEKAVRKEYPQAQIRWPGLYPQIKESSGYWHDIS